MRSAEQATDRLSEILDSLPALAAAIGRGSAQRDLDRELPFEAFRLVREREIGTLRLPERLGGPGGSVRDVIQAIILLASGDSNVAHALRSHFNFSEMIYLAPDSPAQRENARLILEGSLFGGAHTEIGTSRPGEIKTTLFKTSNGYRLNGRKYYATGTDFADFASFSALNEAGETVFARLPIGRRGIKILDDWDGMGQRLTGSGGILLTDVEVLEGEFFVANSTSSPSARHASTFRQLFLMACQAGIVRNVLADAIDYGRSQARPITHSPAATARDDHFVQRQVGEIAAFSHAIDALVLAAADTLDESASSILADHPEIDRILAESAITVAKAQVAVGPLALRAAEGIFNVGGASATSRKRNFDRHWRNVRTITSHNPLFYKEKAVGDYLLNAVPPPTDGGYF
jgi:alkylation response protein AidB-like acyl-CoA dehydrogenase